MPDSPLQQIIEDTGGFSSKFIPKPFSSRPAQGCTLPEKGLPVGLLYPVPVVSNEQDCAEDFIEFPVIPPPFIPPFEGPCPDGFTFEAQYVPLVGQTLTQLPVSGALRPIQLNNFDMAAIGVDSQSEGRLPEIHIRLPIAADGTEPGGGNTFPVVEGLRYVVTIAGYDPATMQGKGVFYDGTLYKHGQTFRAVAGETHAAVAAAADNGIISLHNTQRQRVLDYDRSSPTATTLYVDAAGFTLPSSEYAISDFSLRRLVVSVDPAEETGGDIAFIQEDCGGKLVGRININIDDLNIPCASGFGFDAGYVPKAGEQLTISGGTAVNPNGTVDLISLIPTGTSPNTGFTYPLPKLLVNTVGSTWVTAQVTAVNIDGTLTLGSAIPDGTYAGWYLQRINISEGSPTGGRMEYIPQGSCGGVLIGEILIDPPTFDTPCESALGNNTLVASATNFTGEPVNTRALKSVDRLRRNATANSSGWTTDEPITQYISLTHEADACSYKLGFSENAQLNLPDIQIQLTIDGQTYRFNRQFTDGVTDTVRFSATIDSGTLPGGGGGSDGERCLNCCRWS